MIYQKKLPPTNLQLEPPFGTLPFRGEDDVRLAEGDIYPADTLHFTTLSFQPFSKGIPVSGQAEITYFLAEDVLIRSARFREKSIQNDFGESVLGFNLRFFDKEKSDWVDAWAPTGNLPQAIEIELIIKVPLPQSPTHATLENAMQERRFKTIVEIPISETL
jgi:hypothetical protein